VLWEPLGAVLRLWDTELLRVAALGEELLRVTFLTVLPEDLVAEVDALVEPV
jgi:hypothetical protein